MLIASSNGVSETAGTAVLVKKFDFTYHLHEDALLRVNLMNDPEIILRDISKNHVLSLLASFSANGSDHVRRTISGTTLAAAKCSSECEGVPWPASRVFNGAASVILSDKRHWL